ncbi:DUF397 domain-containing protein [Streptomyces sp. LRE541]|uniref:DUF397 domain-containing protein n=1 Tax=Streptomyces sp. LRE541 TaxID=2931983 RepID=UPI00200DD9B6|nr:DUF397 domain-containing protein [Streptomyces sp. LRE541]UPZ29561.1 DUF397 domain-containing protein [Streptomyces sp. LRE541]
MLTPNIWKKSSFSGGGQGDACVEVAHRRTHIAIRDSKTSAGVALTFPTEAFVPFVGALKSPGFPMRHMEP